MSSSPTTSSFPVWQDMKMRLQYDSTPTPSGMPACPIPLLSITIRAGSHPPTCSLSFFPENIPCCSPVSHLLRLSMSLLFLLLSEFPCAVLRLLWHTDSPTISEPLSLFPS